MGTRWAVAFFTCVIPALLCAACVPPPEIDVTVAIEGDRVVFDIDHRHVNGLTRFQVHDQAGALLWDLNLSYERGHRIEYGRLPPGGSTPARQAHPPDSAEPPDIRGTTVQVSVQYQYDRPHPATSTFSKAIAVP